VLAVAESVTDTIKGTQNAVASHHKDSGNLPPRKKTTHERCYEYFTVDGTTKEQAPSKVGVNFKAVESYTSSSYQSCDAGVLRDRLGLTNGTVRET